jgi:hypothetical protein
MNNIIKIKKKFKEKIVKSKLFSTFVKKSHGKNIPTIYHKKSRRGFR